MNEAQLNVLKDLSLSLDSYVFRYTDEEFINSDHSGSLSINVNPQATEMVQDVYGSGHLLMAKDVGPGLAFTTQPEPEFGGSGRVLVKAKVGSLLKNRCVLYPDKSTYTLNSIFIQSPDPTIEVEKAVQ